MSETISETTVKIGGHVTFVDPKGQRHDALVTMVWGDTSVDARNARLHEYYAKTRESGAKWASEETEQKAVDLPFVMPSINCVWVENDESKSDPYGRQIARSTSVVHRSAQPAHGMFWE